jgi:hypothetical protein
MRQPNTGYPTPTQPLMQSMSAQMSIKDGRQSQSDHNFKQEYKVVYPFCGYGDLRCHPLRLSDNSPFSQIFQRMDSNHQYDNHLEPRMGSHNTQYMPLVNQDRSLHSNATLLVSRMALVEKPNSTLRFLQVL